MSYKIVVDSCCELPEEFKKQDKFESVPLGLEVGDYQTMDDDNFNQAEFLERIAKCPTCPKSSCPSPERYMEAYKADVDNIYVVTLSSHLSGSYNSAVLGKNLYEEAYGKKNIHIVDSESASGGETQIALLAAELEEQGLPFEEIVERLEEYRSAMHTIFVLDNLETLRKNGRLSRVKALVATTLSIKPVLASDKGNIVQIGQGVGNKKALQKMVDIIMKEVTDLDKKRLIMTHCNCAERAAKVKEMLEERAKIKEIMILDTGGLSTMYANDGGIIIAV